MAEAVVSADLKLVLKVPGVGFCPMLGDGDERPLVFALVGALGLRSGVHCCWLVVWRGGSLVLGLFVTIRFLM